MTLGEVAKATGLHERTIIRLERRGIIEATRNDKGWRVFDPSVVEFLKRCYQRPDAPPSHALRPPIYDAIEALQRIELALLERGVSLPDIRRLESSATGEATGEGSDPLSDAEEMERLRRAAFGTLRVVDGGRAAS
jgi:DNA-binding transcriptional MerR regulator